MKNLIIVFGHTGYIGQNVYQSLKKKNLLNKNIVIKGVSSKQVNLINKSSISKLKKIIQPNSVLIICSAIKSNYGTTLELMRKNVEMIENLAAVISKKQVKKIIYLSSKAVYGVHTKNKLMNENSKINPDTFYSLSKVMSENILKLVLKKKDKQKLLILRPSIVYGPNENLIAGSPSGFLNLNLKKNKISIWGDGTEIRDFLYIDDLVNVIIKSIKSKFFGNINVGGYRSSYISLIKKIYKITKIKPIIFKKKRTTPKIDKKYSKNLLLKNFPSVKFTSINSGIKKIYKLDHQR